MKNYTHTNFCSIFLLFRHRPIDLNSPDENQFRCDGNSNAGKLKVLFFRRERKIDRFHVIMRAIGVSKIGIENKNVSNLSYFVVINFFSLKIAKISYHFSKKWIIYLRQFGNLFLKKK